MEKKKLKKLAKALGAKVITDPEEIKKFEKKYGLPHPLLPIAKKSDSTLTVHCQKHPRYRADRKPKLFCPSCLLLYVLRCQHIESPDHNLGSLNPHAYFLSEVDLEDACGGLEVSKV